MSQSPAAVMLVVVLSCLSMLGSAHARDVPVNDADGLATAIAQALPGDRILVAAGTYELDGNPLATAVGSAAAPIVVRAVQPRSVLLRFGSSGNFVEGFRIRAPHWRFEGLDIEGACANDDNCEHAFHVTAGADAFVLRDSVVRDFNAQIKGNGDLVAGVMVFPDDALIERNRFFDTRARQTDHPVTKIDVVGGQRWVVRDNVIHDFQKEGGDTISYAAFLKGNSSQGLFERNLVICARDFSGGIRIGLSFGGGGTAAALCEGGSCTTEHRQGTMRNNLILHCNDVGIYLNRAADTLVLHNTLYDTTGIDVRFETSTADIRNNLVGSAIRNRNAGSSTQAGNLAGLGNADFEAWFTAPGEADFRLLDGDSLVDLGVATPEVHDDYCRNVRDDGLPDIGALEYDAQPPCDTARSDGFVAAERMFVDGFESPQ